MKFVCFCSQPPHLAVFSSILSLKKRPALVTRDERPTEISKVFLSSNTGTLNDPPDSFLNRQLSNLHIWEVYGSSLGCKIFYRNEVCLRFSAITPENKLDGNIFRPLCLPPNLFLFIFPDCPIIRQRTICCTYNDIN